MTPDQLEQAACRDAPPSMFFPDTATLHGPGVTGERYVAAWRNLAAPALELCAVCPIVGPCLTEALADGDLDGVRGGLTPPELRQMAGRVRRPRTTPARRHGTEAGYVEHLRRAEPACALCRDAHAAYGREWKARRNAS